MDEYSLSSSFRYRLFETGTNTTCALLVTRGYDGTKTFVNSRARASRRPVYTCIRVISYLISSPSRDAYDILGVNRGDDYYYIVAEGFFRNRIVYGNPIIRSRAYGTRTFGVDFGAKKLATCRPTGK